MRGEVGDERSVTRGNHPTGKSVNDQTCRIAGEGLHEIGQRTAIARPCHIADHGAPVDVERGPGQLVGHGLHLRDDAMKQITHARRCGAAGVEHFLVIERLPGHPGGEIGDQGKPENLHAQ